MVDMKAIIARNISLALKKSGKKQYELANALGYSKQVVSNMLLGSRMVNALDLKKIAIFCNVSMDSLVEIPQHPMEENVVRAFMGEVNSAEAKKGIEIADGLIDMYLFHARVYKSGVIGMKKRSSL